jgi:hypothetical protein
VVRARNLKNAASTSIEEKSHSQQVFWVAKATRSFRASMLWAAYRKKMRRRQKAAIRTALAAVGTLTANSILFLQFFYFFLKKGVALKKENLL